MMIASEKWPQNLSDNIQVLLKKIKFIKKITFYSEKTRNLVISAASLNKISHSLAPCERIFKFRHTFYEQSKAKRKPFTYETRNENQPGTEALYLIMYWKLSKILTWIVDTFLTQVLNLYYRNLGLTYLIVWKWRVFRHFRNFENFRQIFLAYISTEREI